MVSKLFALRGNLSKTTSTIIEIFGLIFLLIVWSSIVGLQLVPKSLLPSPLSVLTSFYQLHFEDALIRELFYSIKINVLGYIEAIILSIPLGFILGLFPLFREMFKRYVDAVRFLPLTALTGVFIAWFGISIEMKVQFLAFGISVFLLPAVIQRVLEVEQVYCDTLYTLGGNKWQIIRYVFIPDVLSKVIEDLRLLCAVSWTYIIVAELLNKAEGGIGSLAYTSARQGRIDKVFAILIVIILVGFVQDRLISFLSKVLFPFKENVK